jgi:hypothetical protein
MSRHRLIFYYIYVSRSVIENTVSEDINEVTEYCVGHSLSEAHLIYMTFRTLALFGPEVIGFHLIGRFFCFIFF